MKKDFSKFIIISFLTISIIFSYILKCKTITVSQSEAEIKKAEIEKVEEIIEKNESVKKISPEISIKLPSHLSYPQTIAQIKKWKEEAPDLTEVGTYGQTKKNVDLYYIRVHNTLDKSPKPVVLITACIHGNEPLASGVTMAYVGNLIDQYGKDKKITDIINTRDLYFIPVVSPDSYTTSRYVDGVDPNRDFPTPKTPEHQSTPTVNALRDFYWKIKPSAVVSGHTYGRLFMTPYGDSYKKTPHEVDFSRIVGKMASLADYKKIHCAELYNKPIDGSEVDWFYRNGSIAICAEYGTHQHKPTLEEIKKEFNRVKDALDLFVVEAPIVKVTVVDEGIDFSKNTGIARNYLRLPNGDLFPAGPYQNYD
jgi:hypothetical protein